MAFAYTIQYNPADDYYRVLGIPPTASSNDIHRAYREHAIRVHPDRNPRRQEWAHTQFNHLNEINDILSDPVLKDEYDRQRAAYLLSLFGEPQAQAQEKLPEPAWQPPAQAQPNIPRRRTTP